MALSHFPFLSVEPLPKEIKVTLICNQCPVEKREIFATPKDLSEHIQNEHALATEQEESACDTSSVCSSQNENSGKIG